MSRFLQIAAIYCAFAVTNAAWITCSFLNQAQHEGERQPSRSQAPTLDGSDPLDFRLPTADCFFRSPVDLNENDRTVVLSMFTDLLRAQIGQTPQDRWHEVRVRSLLSGRPLFSFIPSRCCAGYWYEAQCRVSAGRWFVSALSSVGIRASAAECRFGST
jgi:hypothetical protein